MHCHALDMLWGGLPIVIVLRAPPPRVSLKVDNMKVTNAEIRISLSLIHIPGLRPQSYSGVL